MKRNPKTCVDILAMLSIIVAIITGFMLHRQFNHLHLYHHGAAWWIHVVFALLFSSAVIAHCFQHRPWFTNYRKLPHTRRRVTTILLTFVVLVVVSGLILLCGSRSHFISIFHYATAIICFLLACGHVIKRWKIFSHLL